MDFRVRRAGYDGSTVRENIAWNYRSAKSVVMGWMCSSGHRDNIMSCDTHEIGIGIATDGSGSPYHTQVFACPKGQRCGCSGSGEPDDPSMGDHQPDGQGDSYGDHDSGSGYGDHGSDSGYGDYGSGSGYGDHDSGSGYGDYGSESVYGDHGSGDYGSGSGYGDQGYGGHDSGSGYGDYGYGKDSGYGGYHKDSDHDSYRRYSPGRGYGRYQDKYSPYNQPSDGYKEDHGYSPDYGYSPESDYHGEDHVSSNSPYGTEVYDSGNGVTVKRSGDGSFVSVTAVSGGHPSDNIWKGK